MAFTTTRATGHIWPKMGVSLAGWDCRSWIKLAPVMVPTPEIGAPVPTVPFNRKLSESKTVMACCAGPMIAVKSEFPAIDTMAPLIRLWGVAVVIPIGAFAVLFTAAMLVGPWTMFVTWPFAF